MTISGYDWSGQQELLEYVQEFVKQESHFWRPTGTGLVRLDRPAELRHLAGMIEQAFQTRVHDWWVMKQEPGAYGALLHAHNNWDTYVYYPFYSDRAILGEDWRVVPHAGDLVYLPEGTLHGVENDEGEQGTTRYSCVFLAHPKEGGTDDQETQGQET